MDADAQETKLSEASAVVPAGTPDPAFGKVVTTDEEIEAFHIVKAIVREMVAPARITLRDSESYCAILLDDNNRKTVCRFRFGPNKKTVAVFDEQKNETRLPISELNDIYALADRLKSTISSYEKKVAEPSNLG